MAPSHNQNQNLTIKSSQMLQTPVNSTESITATGPPIASKYNNTSNTNFQSSYTNLLPNQDNIQTQLTTQSSRPSTSSLSSSIFTHGKDP